MNILYLDQQIVVVDKPCGMPVHRDKFSAFGEKACLQELRDQLKSLVYPVHRLDRPTSGILMFALNKDALSKLSKQFMERKVSKTYLAVVRGWILKETTCSDALTDDGHVRDALTTFRPIKNFEFSWPNKNFTSSRYSLVEVLPNTGRFHQIRRHANHIGHPIVGDTTHGDGHHNRLWRDKLHCQRLLLHASELRFSHPETHERLHIKLNAPFQDLVLDPSF